MRVTSLIRPHEYLPLAVLLILCFVSQASVYGAEGDASSAADFYDGLRAWDLKEEPTAAAIWLKAAEWGDVRSMQKVAELYEKGKVLPQDVSLAYFWFSQAARRGASSANYERSYLRQISSTSNQP